MSASVSMQVVSCVLCAGWRATRHFSAHNVWNGGSEANKGRPEFRLAAKASE
jgi:hypothetical protein